MLSPATRVTSFDGTESVVARVARPERYRDLPALLANGPAIARGAGLSYCAASVGKSSVAVDMTRFDRLLGFDEERGLVTIEAGTRIGALTQFLATKRHFLPVMPGYPTITVGGCIAFDVHGKSQCHSGNFAESVASLELLHPDHGTLRLSSGERPDLFELTLGGLGLTGIVTRATLRVRKLPAPAMLVEAVPCRTLGDAVDTMRQRTDGVDALYSWHDFNRRSGFGRGIVFLERFVEGRVRERPPPARNPARRGRFALWNPLTTRLALGAYRLLQALRKRRTLALHGAMFPIDGLEGYYAAFGKRGFREYQLIVPYAAWDEFARALEPCIQRSGVPITLASLKLFRGARRHVSFAGEGVCLAIDVPATARSLELFRALDELAVRCGAVVNLSKDSRVSRDLCRAVFPGFDAFSRALTAFDPKRRFQSELRERLDV